MKKVSNIKILMILLGYFALVFVLLVFVRPAVASTKAYKPVQLEPNQSSNHTHGRWYKVDDCTFYGKVFFKDGSELILYFPRNIICPQK